MVGDELIVGREYVFRQQPRAGSPILKATLVAKVGRGGRVRIRFEDGPHPGLEEYARTRQLIVRWSERSALLRDEERLERLYAHADKVSDPAVAVAVRAVLEATGEAGIDVRAGVSTLLPAELQRICDRAGVPAEPVSLHPLAFRDRHGLVQLPLDGVVRLARAFAAAEPETVNRYITAEEEELRARGETPGERWWHHHLREQSPGLALARQWAGLEREADALRREIARLRSLLARAVHDLESTGHEHHARRLLRALGGA